ncbi:MAG: glycoside hydrolase family 38 C-terminal domain-containing protein [Polyangiaceae bacterium]|nr:glycoside hydrolase family 38 C-terminal domain-containing protein [Polyangiaceae bacterium]
MSSSRVSLGGMVHAHTDIRRQRLINFRQQLARSVIEEWIPLHAECALADGPMAFGERETLKYRPIKEGESWGSAWQSAWFHLQGKVPAHWAGSEVVARIDLNGEILVFDAQGCPKMGLTNGSVFDGHYNKDILRLYSRCVGGESVSVWLESVANGLFGVHREDPERLEDQGHLHGKHDGRAVALRLCRFNREMWHLWLDVDVLFSLWEALPNDSRRKRKVFRALNQAADVFVGEGRVEAARGALAPQLAIPADASALCLTAVGHAHIDTAWLWQVKESVRKCARTFSSQIDLIERYPGYVFGASQAQHYQFVKDHYPQLYTKIKAAVAAGSWEVQGGMWVEADANLISGESMVRQFVIGKNFFRAEFGVEVKNLWLPDVFGYSGNLPQILAKSGCPYFLTQKMSWSRYNKFPHNTFNWRGIDGSEVLAHFPPENNYNASVMPSSLLTADREYAETAICDEAISLFGIGNGGGGPKDEYLERAKRVANLNGLPSYQLGAAQPALERLSAHKAELSTWVGELYLEAHRGTFTTQANIKRLNRRLEEALRATEMLCATAGLASYPSWDLDQNWKALLLNQFHDIIPGSSIHAVYEVTTKELEGALSSCQALAANAVAALSTSDSEALSVFNPASTPYVGTFQLPAGFGSVALSDGTPLVCQATASGSVCHIMVPAQGFLSLRRLSNAPVAASVAGNGSSANVQVLENQWVRYEFDGNLRLVRAFDKELSREILVPNERGNELALYEDRPHAFDAWEVDEYYEQQKVDVAKVVPGSISRITGPVRQGLEARLTVGQSTLKQRVWLGEHSRRVDFVTEVDWAENHKMLRVSFPTTLRANEANFEIQYGFVPRPTHRNTAWDHARFEVVGHRYADLSEGDWGVALLNDCKYGYKVHGGVLDLNLLRAPTDPDPIADRGQHRFTYSLLPHVGQLAESVVFQEAAVLNQGLLSFAGVRWNATALPVTLQGEGVELSVAKKAENDECYVVRVVETRGYRAQAVLQAADPQARIVPTNLIEWEDVESEASVGKKALVLGPFEIQTFKVWAR